MSHPHIHQKNFTHIPIGDIPLADEYHQCNFSQPQPDMTGANPIGIRLFPGDDTPRIFRDCNLMNCEPPPGSTVEGGLWVIKETDVDDEEDDVLIDGHRIRSRQRVHRVHGRRNPDGTYEYKPTPEVQQATRRRVE